MLYSKLFPPVLKTPPKDAEVISHRLLWQGGFIDQPIGAGLYTILPLGWRVMTKIMAIIREEINNIGGQELFMPSLQPKELWLKSDRWDHMDPPLFKLKDRHGKDYCLASTHEEVITDLAGRFIQSYKDLPLALYQIQNKFRNEMRFSGGLLRVREFLMKDLYSFHAGEADLDRFYEDAKKSYFRIFGRCGLKIICVEAESGTIGGKISHEFMVLSETGEDTIFYCPRCLWGANAEKLKNQDGAEKCYLCGESLTEARAIECGHIFKLGKIYAEKLGVKFTDKDGKQETVLMGCYGIGVGRLMAAIVEASHDDFGIIWPEEVAPFRAELVKLDQWFDFAHHKLAKLDQFDQSTDVLVDNREDISAGEKFMTADLLGCPWRVVISEKSLNAGGAEIKKRGEKNTEIVPLEKIEERIRIR